MTKVRDTTSPVGKVVRDENSPDWIKRKIDWITFYRRNIHIFIQHYFKIYLYPYQILWIDYIHKCNYFISIASRASAKSWLIGVYACAYAVLYPHSEIVIFSETQKTASIVMGKIEGLRASYPVIANEIEHLYNNPNSRECVFNNTSTIKVVACKESGRGHRANLIIGEEFALVDKTNYDSIIKPFKITRQTPFSKLPEWSSLKKEEPKEILISSTKHKGLWWYDDTCKLIKDMVRGKNFGFIAFDYLLSIYHGIKTKEMIEQEKSTMDLITFQEEYCNIPFGENSDAYFKLSMFERARTIKRAFYPQRKDSYNSKKNPYDIKKIDGELRVISVDLATRKSKENDNTIIACTRLFPTSEGYIREVCYMESHLGENTIVQAFRIKQLFHDFGADYLVLDIAQAGMKTCPPHW